MTFMREFIKGGIMTEPEEYLVLKQLTDALDDLKIEPLKVEV